MEVFERERERIERERERERELRVARVKWKRIAITS
jgi:hypothetical protein